LNLHDPQPLIPPNHCYQPKLLVSFAAVGAFSLFLGAPASSKTFIFAPFRTNETATDANTAIPTSVFPYFSCFNSKTIYSHLRPYHH